MHPLSEPGNHRQRWQTTLNSLITPQPNTYFLNIGIPPTLAPFHALCPNSTQFLTTPFHVFLTTPKPHSPVQQPKSGVQARGEQALPVMRHCTARDRVVQLIDVHTAHAHVKAPHTAVHTAGYDFSVAHHYSSDTVLWGGQFECLIDRFLEHTHTISSQAVLFGFINLPICC